MTITLNAASKVAGLLLSNTSSGNASGNAGNGSNRLLVVVALQRASILRTISMTYAGVALTQVASVAQETSLTNKLEASIWYLAAPATGTNTLSVSASGLTNLEVHACVFEGVDQSAPLDKHNSATSAGSTTPGASVAQPTTDGQVVIAGMLHEGASASAVNTGTSLQDVDQGAWNTSSAYVIQTTAGAQTIDWTNGESLNWAAAIASFKAAGGGAISVTPAAAACIAQSTGPGAVLGPILMTPATAVCIARSASPAVVLGALTMTGLVARVVARTLGPQVLDGGDLLDVFRNFGRLLFRRRGR